MRRRQHADRQRDDVKLPLEKLHRKATRARYAGRPASPSLAAGQMAKHLKELAALPESALR